MASEKRSRRTILSKSLRGWALSAHHERMPWHDRLTKALAARGYREKKDIAERIGSYGQKVGRWLKGDHEPSYEDLLKLCRLAGVLVDDIIDDTRPLRLEVEAGKADGPVMLREESPPPPSVGHAKTKTEGTDPPQAEPAGEGSGPPTPRAGGRKAKVDLD